MRTAAALALVLAGCGRPEPPPRPPAYLNLPPDAATPAPPLLSQTGAFADVRTLAPAAGLVAYALNLPFWSDGADKWRWVAVPSGGVIRFAPTGEWAFPAGTVFVKHFARGRRRLETRLLVRARAGGVYGVTYRWRADESDADRVDEPVTAGDWYFPGPDDCRKCHTPAVGVLGVSARQLHRDGPGSPENQLVAWSRMGLLDPPVTADELPGIPKLARLEEPGTAEDRARSYLDANCCYCHRPDGAAADFDARYGTPVEKQALVDAPARIDLGLDRARQIAPNDPWRSVALVRVATTEATKMPPLAHLKPDPRGVEVLRAWIASLPGPPVVAPPAIAPAGGDFTEPVTVTIRHPDPAAVVRYTLDGRPPGEQSPAYTGPVRLTGPTTVRARAYKPGHTRSVVVQDTFVVGP